MVNVQAVDDVTRQQLRRRAYSIRRRLMGLPAESGIAANLRFKHTTMMRHSSRSISRAISAHAGIPLGSGEAHKGNSSRLPPLALLAVRKGRRLPFCPSARSREELSHSQRGERSRVLGPDLSASGRRQAQADRGASHLAGDPIDRDPCQPLEPFDGRRRRGSVPPIDEELRA